MRTVQPVAMPPSREGGQYYSVSSLDTLVALRMVPACGTSRCGPPQSCCCHCPVRQAQGGTFRAMQGLLLSPYPLSGPGQLAAGHLFLFISTLRHSAFLEA